MMYDLVLKQLGRHKVRTGLTILGVAIGILLVTSLSSFSEGISGAVNTQLSYLSGIVTVSAKDIGYSNMQLSELDASIANEISNVNGVDKVAALVMGSVPGVGQVFGVNTDVLDVLKIDVNMKEGRLFEDGTDEIVLGFSYAESSGLKVGDELSMRGKKHEIVGVLDYTGATEDSGVLTNLEEAQDILDKKDKISAVMVKPIDPGEAEQLAREIEGLFDNVQALSDKDAARKAGQFTGQLSIMTFALGSIAAVIAGIGIMNVMFMSVRERRREIGAMKALGATTNEILGQVLLEAVAIALIGELIGVVLSFGVVNALNTISTRLPAVITPSLLINVTIFALLLAVFSGLLPARAAARLQPAVVLRYE